MDSAVVSGKARPTRAGSLPLKVVLVAAAALAAFGAAYFLARGNRIAAPQASSAPIRFLNTRAQGTARIDLPQLPGTLPNLARNPTPPAARTSPAPTGVPAYSPAPASTYTSRASVSPSPTSTHSAASSQQSAPTQTAVGSVN